MSSVLLLIILGVCSYFIGNINWAVIISKIKNKDIRDMGSGNPGSLNMGRNFGLKFGLLTFGLDALKGAIPTICSYFITSGRYFNGVFPVCDFALYLSGFCVIMGHIFPVIFKFKGGKGIASTIGVLLITESVHGWEWAVILIMSLSAAVVFIYLTEFGAMGSFIAITPPAVAGSIRLLITYQGNTDKTVIAFTVVINMLILLICFFTWFAHRKNIERMLSGDEHPTSFKAMVVKMKAKKLDETEKRA